MPPISPSHEDQLVDQFALVMKDKLKRAADKGRSGWRQCPPEQLSLMLRQHVEKGDPVDVANFCMFLAALDEPISRKVLTQRELVMFNLGALVSATVALVVLFAVVGIHRLAGWL